MYTENRLNEKVGVESGIDIDWYFIDKFGRIAIVASAGGLLPDPVATDMDRLRRMITYFRSLPVLSNEIIIEKYVLDEVDKYTPQQKEDYLEDLYYMVSKGFYYFDKIEVNRYFDFRYALKAKPSVPLIINKQDSNMQDFVPNIVIDDDLDNIKFFLVNEFP